MRHLIVLGAMLAIGCGGSPAAPSRLAPGPRPASLQPGLYILTISRGSRADAGPFLSLCLWTANSANVPASVSVDVMVEPDVEGYRFSWKGAAVDRALTGRIRLAPGGSISGTMGGRASSQGGPGVVVTGASGGFTDAQITGTALSTTAAQGDVDGHVELTLGSASSVCTPMMWTLAAR